MASNPNPTRISAPMWRLWEEFLAYEPQARLGGIYADKAGYHNYRANLPSSDYSVEEVANDRKGSAQYAAGIDITLNEKDMILYTNRLDAAYRARDPRLFIDGEPISREFIGTKNGTVVYCYMLTGGIPQGVGADSGVDWGRDKTHLWHIHISIIRKFTDSWRALSGILSILKNEDYDDWEFNEMAISAVDIAKIWQATPWAADYSAATALQRAYLLSNQALTDVRALNDVVNLIATKVDLDPAELLAIKAVVPTAEENAQAVVAALGGVDTSVIAEALRNVLSPEKLAELKEAL